MRHCFVFLEENRAEREKAVGNPFSPRGRRCCEAADEGALMESRIAKARQLRKTMTDAERKLWYLLRSRRFSGFKFRRQEPVGSYVADFLCYEARLIVEADGSQHAESTHDAKRDAWLKHEGFRVLRFWNHEIFTARQQVEDTIYATLTTPHPAAALPPSPARGEGPSPTASASPPARGEGLFPTISTSPSARGEGKELRP